MHTEIFKNETDNLPYIALNFQCPIFRKCAVWIAIRIIIFHKKIKLSMVMIY